MASIFDLFTGLGGVYVQREQAKANNMLSAVNAEAGNKVRTAKNAVEAKTNSLKRWMQSVNNNRVLDQGGSAIEANAVNFRRNMDAAAFEDFGTQVRRAEQMGAAAAAQGASRVGGAVVDMVNGATALRDALSQQRTDDIRKMQGFDAAQRAASIMRQTVGSLDNSIILDTFDTNRDVAQKSAIPSYGPVVMAFAMDAAEDAMKMMAGMPPQGGKAEKAADLKSWDETAKKPNFSQFSFRLDGFSTTGLGRPEESSRSW